MATTSISKQNTTASPKDLPWKCTQGALFIIQNFVFTIIEFITIGMPIGLRMWGLLLISAPIALFFAIIFWKLQSLIFFDQNNYLFKNQSVLIVSALSLSISWVCIATLAYSYTHTGDKIVLNFKDTYPLLETTSILILSFFITIALFYRFYLLPTNEQSHQPKQISLS